jgi:acetyltransferase-like isoleucine patch superfamily enzyme
MLQFIKQSIGRKIRELLWKFLLTEEFATELQKKYIANYIASCRNQVDIDATSCFYEQARVFNFQNNIEQISIAKGTHIRGELLLFPFGGKITIGHNCYIGEHTRIWSAEEIRIGNHVLISHNVNIIDTNSHELNHIERAESYKKMLQEGHPTIKPNVLTAPIIVEDYAWINFNVAISKGVRIGKGAIIAPNTVVTTDVPDFCLFAGTQGKFIKYLNDNNHDNS